MATRLGIELLPHVCRIVKVAAGAPPFGGGAPARPRVRAFREIPYSASDPDAFTVELRQALKGLGRRASAAVWGLHSAHQSFLLPPAAPADLAVIARREARSAPGGLPAPPLSDTVVAGALRDARRQTGYAAVPADDLRARVQPLVDAGLTLDAVVTPALAHAALASQRRALLPDAVVAVLSVNAQATALTVVHGGVVTFARELPWGDRSDGVEAHEGQAGRAAFASRVAAEVRRSLVYVRQSQGIEVSRLLVCGDLFDLRTLTAPLLNDLAIDVETLDVDDDLDLSKLPEPSDALRSRLGAWRTALALAAGTTPLPGLRRQDERPAMVSSELAQRTAGAALVAALVVAAGWGVFGYLTSGVAARQERMRRTIGVLEPELQRLEDERRRAALANARQAALEAFASQGPRLARVLEAFSQAAPPEIALSAIRVESGAASWELVVEGRAEGGDAGAAHASLRAFLLAIEASPLLGKPFSPPSLRARTADPPETAEDVRAEAPPLAPIEPAQPVAAPRPAASGPAFIEVARDGRLYRIPLRRQAGNLEAARRADEARRLEAQAASLRDQEALARAQAGAAAPGLSGRQAPSVVDFTLRYEVAK
jgi:hypothetical protein